MKGYVTLGTNDLDSAARFYEQLLESIGVKRQREIPNHIVYFGDESGTELAVIIPADGKSATAGNGTMVALRIDSKKKYGNSMHWPSNLAELMREHLDRGALEPFGGLISETWTAINLYSLPTK